MNTYNNLLLEIKQLLNKKLYEDNVISYEIFETVNNNLIERMDYYEHN